MDYDLHSIQEDLEKSQDRKPTQKETSMYQWAKNLNYVLVLCFLTI